MAKITVTQIEQALKAKVGNISQAAAALGVARSTLYRRIEGSPTLQEVLTDSREEMVDIAESALRREVLEGNITAIIFTLKTIGKQRGYVERVEQQVSGTGDGGAIVHEHRLYDDMTDEDLMRVITG